MNLQWNEALLLTQEELGVLLQAAGCTGWYGFALETETLPEETAVRLLNEMVNKGLLHADGQAFYLDKQAAAAMRTLQQAKRVVVVSEAENELPPYCCYIGDQILICEWMSQRKNTMKLKLCGHGQLCGLLQDEGYFTWPHETCLQAFENPTGIEAGRLKLRWSADCGELVCTENGELKSYPFQEEHIRLLLAKLCGAGEMGMEWSGV